ncbi:hypothetical protein [Chitinophaga barathri]|uniref:Uncharacterized protein n=1 Tax=Chitinophaga barathri TaxID=1647451 RepID=A0A3N4MJ99_9BACT|nr:hypothetical protein [Chitinophaga barathri]RPD41897.1 hypothetical protein EG028_06970 [Chitinophaga barathri]
MITQEKLKIFKHYSGDLNALRQTNSTEKDTITAHDWFVIGNLLQDIMLVSKGLASEAYAVRVWEELKHACADQETVDELKKMAE